MTWLAKAYVFNQILDHGSLLSNSILDSFYTAEYLTDFGLLLGLEHRLHASSFLETYDRTDLVLSIHGMMDSIAQIDSILTTSPVNVQDYRDDRILVTAELADSMVVWLGIMESERTERIMKTYPTSDIVLVDKFNFFKYFTGDIPPNALCG
jgi:hypothetical protein